MSSRNSGSNSSRSSADLPIMIAARDVGIDQTIAKVTRFSESIRSTGVEINKSPSIGSMITILKLRYCGLIFISSYHLNTNKY
ncbi:MAG: hypothetical protein L0H53_03290 [Candidatus Nitrosocosmicus sp.]|nr:hypothetical protein [Candidatus Nitrosocosmicus sp.]MDN5868088.1 hypothetical protein [Candidatus Nitrosocosmicus sp.]